ncbi:MAG: thermonuclease family protein [Deltaproteobacteria bacterium]|nr:thermonuclease family protein [Deltaproteobacteria bacterium]
MSPSERKILIAVAAVAIFAAATFSTSRVSPAAETMRGLVIGVQDGDTITVRTDDFEQIRVRFYGVDSPEKDQPHGKIAGDFLKKLVHGKKVDLEVMDIDRYGRHVCLVKLEGTLVNLVMVEKGHAWLYGAYCKSKNVCARIGAAEGKAQKAGLGLWGNPDATAPWDHRKNKRRK